MAWDAFPMADTLMPIWPRLQKVSKMLIVCILYVHCTYSLIEHCWPNIMYHWCSPPPLIFILVETLHSAYSIYVVWFTSNQNSNPYQYLWQLNILEIVDFPTYFSITYIFILLIIIIIIIITQEQYYIRIISIIIIHYILQHTCTLYIPCTCMYVQCMYIIYGVCMCVP